MKIFHYQRPDRQPNFGDELNLWLWPKLRPNFFDDDHTTLFLGTGTLLNDRLAERTQTAKQVIIFSTGVGYERPLTAIPAHWRIICVRGSYSAKRLGLSAANAIADGGILVNQCFQPSGLKTAGYSLMPHIHHANFAEATWQQLCQQLGMRYIDPRWPVEQVLTAISETEILLAEAMHGAIVADALRTPWIPIVTSPRILAFKWQDWCASVNVPYQPQYLPILSDYPPYARGFRSSLRATQHWLHSWQQFPQKSPASFSGMIRQLQQIQSSVTPCLSQSTQLEQLVERLGRKLKLLG